MYHLSDFSKLTFAHMTDRMKDPGRSSNCNEFQASTVETNKLKLSLVDRSTLTIELHKSSLGCH